MDQNLIDRMPTIVAYPLNEYQTEENPVLKLWAACDTVEMMLRLLVMVGLTDIQRASAELPKELLGELRSRIEAPTLGMWRGMAQAVTNTLPHDAMVPEIKNWVPKICAFLDGDKGASVNAENSFTELRNRLAHGGGVTKQAASTLLEIWTPKFETLIAELAGLTEIVLVVQVQDGALAELRGPSLSLPPFTADDRTISVVMSAFRSSEDSVSKDVVFVRGGRAAPLWPLKLYGIPQHPDPDRAQSVTMAPQAYVRRGETFLQLTPIGAEIAESVSDTDALDHFRKLFRLDESATTSGYDQTIRKEAAQFVGRSAELTVVRELTSQATQGVLWLSGNAGIGKSYVMARLSADWLEAHGNDEELTLAYRFRVGDGGCSQDAFLRFAVERLEAFLNNDSTRREPNLLLRLRALLTQCAPKRVWFLLDGMDEIIQRDPRFCEDVVFALASLPGVVWLCAGRPLPELQSAFRPDRCKVIFADGLPPMNDGDIRTLLVENIGELRKILLTRDVEEEGRIDNPFIARVAHHAAGLPLYVRYVVNDIKGGQYRVLDVGEALPKSLSHYHAVLLRRLGIGTMAQLLTPLVTTLAAAREPLTVEILATLLRQRRSTPKGDAGVQLVFRGLAAVETMIRRAVTPDGTEGYTIYHDSLRQHMGENPDVSEALELSTESLRDWCAEWPTHRSPYALRQYAGHLADAEDLDGLYALADDDRFLQAQAIGLPTDPDAPLRTLRTALQAAIDTTDPVRMANYVLRHAERVVALQQESPLHTLNPDDPSTLTRAWELADLFPIEDSTLWYLLIAWKLKRSGKLSDASATLERLSNFTLVPLIGWKAHTAVFGIFEAVSVNVGISHLLSDRLLSYYDRIDLIKRLAARYDFVDIALTLARTIPDEYRQSEALAAIAKALAGAGQVEQALDIARSVPKERDWSKALVAIAAAFAKAGQVEKANDTFKLALDTARNKSWQSEAFTAIAEAFVKAGQVEQALAIARSISSEWEQFEALVAVAKALVETGQVEKADDTLQLARNAARTIPNEYWRSDALAAVAEALVGIGKIEQAVVIAQSMPEELCKQSKAIAAVAKALADAGQVEQARDIARSISDEYLQSEALTAIANALTTTGQMEQALDTARTIPSKYGQSDALATIAEALVGTGQAEKADDTFKLALDTARTISSRWYQFKAPTPVAEALASAGQVEQARDIARSISSKSEQSKALTAVAKAFTSAGQVEQALDIARSISDKYWQSEAYAAIAEVLANMEQMEQALDIARSMPNELYKQSKVLVAIAKALMRMGRTEQANDTFKLALDTARIISSKSEQSSAFLAIAEALASVGQVEQARDTARSISSKSEQSKALIAIAEALANMEQIEQALNVCREITDVQVHTRLLVRIAQYQLSDDLNIKLVEMAGVTLLNREEALGEFIESLSKGKNAIGVYRLLIPCAFYLGAAYRACCGLALVHPDQASVIARLLTERKSA